MDPAPQDDTANMSPRSRLSAKLKKQRSARAPGNGPHRPKRKRPDPVPTAESTQDRLLLFPQWLTRQIVRSWPEVSHNKHPFMLLFTFDMNGDPLTTDATAMVGSRLDVLLTKVNGGIYYQSSTHMDGIQKRIGKDFSLTPAQLIYVHDPTSHVKGATVDLSTDISHLAYVATIPAALARDDVQWDVPIDIVKHLPHIKSEVDKK